MSHSLNIDAALEEIHTLNGYLYNKCPNLKLGIVLREEVLKNPSIYHTFTPWVPRHPLDHGELLLLCLYEKEICVSSIELLIDSNTPDEIIISSKTADHYTRRKYNKLLRIICIIISSKFIFKDGPKITKVISEAENPISMWSLISMFNTTCTIRWPIANGGLRNTFGDNNTGINMFLKGPYPRLSHVGLPSTKFQNWVLYNTDQEDAESVFLDFELTTSITEARGSFPIIAIDIEENLATAHALFYTVMESAGTDEKSLHCTSRIKALPENWEEKFDTDGEWGGEENAFYYYNKLTNESQLDFPDIEGSGPLLSASIEEGTSVSGSQGGMAGGYKRRRRVSKRKVSKRRVSKRRVTKRRKNKKTRRRRR